MVPQRGSYLRRCASRNVGPTHLQGTLLGAGASEALLPESSRQVGMDLRTDVASSRPYPATVPQSWKEATGAGTPEAPCLRL